MKELTKNLKCVVMRNGVEIWKEEERLNNLTKTLVGGNKVGFIEIDNEMINSVDIVGVFTAETMNDMTRRKNGQWKCQWGYWHDRKDKCEHLDPEKEERREEYKEKFYKEKGYYPAK